MNNSISIVIPTVNYNEYIDRTIDSCLNLDYIKLEIIVSINNINVEGFKRSKHFENPKIRWECINKKTVPMHESVNNAISYASNEWLFILSDDDILVNGIFKEIDLNTFSTSTLYSTRINIIDENDAVVRENSKPKKEILTSLEAFELYFNNKIHHHISLFLFHKSMYRKVKKIVFAGYPNGYYIDTIFHGKLIANCDQIIMAQNIVFSRRESSTQGSAKFYFDQDVNDYFKIIVDELFKDEKFKHEALRRYGSKEKFYRKMIQDRFYTEWTKLHNPVYKQPFSKKLELLYNHILYWNTGKKFKFFSVVYILLFGTKKIIPQSLRENIKNFVR